MGFGSYDESDRREQTIDTDDDSVLEREADHDGKVTYDSTDKSTDELIAGLEAMKNDPDSGE